LRLRLWVEDLAQAPNSGRRFKLICQIHSKSHVPFVSLDLKNIDSVYSYLAVIDRQGLLSVYEPTNPDDFKEWSLIDQWHVCQPPPGRGQETSFKVRFDQNPTTLPYISSLSDDKNMLSLVATAMNEVKIYLSICVESNGSLDSGASLRQLAFVEAAKLPVHPALVRDVQWAPFNVRGTDLLATACRDGCVRIYGLDVSAIGNNSKTLGPANSATSARHASQVQVQRSAPQSSLTTAITGRNPNAASSLSASGVARFAQQTSNVSLPFKYIVTQVADLANVHKDVWALAWDSNGQVLMSNGSDGITKMWKQSVMSGAWMLFADQEISIESGDEADEDIVASKQERDGS
jgi:nucleoporin SEH1